MFPVFFFLKILYRHCPAGETVDGIGGQFIAPLIHHFHEQFRTISDAGRIFIKLFLRDDFLFACDGVEKDDFVIFPGPCCDTRQFFLELRQQFQDLGLGSGIRCDPLYFYLSQSVSDLLILVGIEMAVYVLGDLYG